ncbi:hypothetical protein CFD26_108172 [Aspergillus turcosus]|uniref:DNA2/NAM7 helicase-like C-terminal domain-containing protein n=1 Tax=Aspergillus turcosus TaxID=1245748 RepID=A0A421DBF6_9EURO|nr:hypothetical protein CFD26_108172 [Aspergillus turcosus]
MHIQTAIDLCKEDPSRPPVASEVLAGLGVRRIPMGLLSTGAEIVEAPIGDPGFEWAGTKPQLSQRSRINSDFAAVVYALVEKLFRETPITPDQIAVLTPYRGQIHLHYNLFGSNGLQGVRIHIVDSFALSDIVELSTY